MKKKLLIFVSFMLTMTIFITNANYVYAEENSNPLFSFTANKNQLELMDALAEENPDISHGEILQKTVPNLWKQLPDTVKRTLYNSRFKGNVDDTEDYDKGIVPTLEQITYSSSIRKYGNSLEFSSTTNIPQGVSWEYCITTTRLGDTDDNSHGYDFRVDTYEDNPTGGTFKISAVLDPPSGRYRAFGNHLIANAETSGYEFISTSSWMDYINPYEIW